MSSNRRAQRVGDEMRRLLADLISRELKDPRIPMMTSVTSVELSNDLSVATCWVSVLGEDVDADEVHAALEGAAGFLRRELGKRMRLRVSPELRFRIDRSIEHGFELSRMIDEAVGRRSPSTADTNLDEAPEASDEDTGGA